VARPLRLQLPGGTFHVTAHGCAERWIFRDAEDRLAFVTVLADVIRRQGWQCLTFCLMSTHYHVLLRTPEPNLAAGMQLLNNRFARYFNRRHGGSGAVFRSRYHSGLIETDGHLLEVCRYIALNPVRAGLCSRPEEWNWSSYGASVGTTRSFPFVSSDQVLELFAEEERTARGQLKRFVEDGLRTPAVTQTVPDTCLTPVVGY
jgi:putative transposase